MYIVSQTGPIARSIEVSPGINIEYDQANNVVGLEILRASRVLEDKVIASIHAKQAGVL